MEACEQKHQRIKRYAKNTTYSNKWPMIFRHEFVQLIFLRENGFDEKNYRRKMKKYLPDVGEGRCSYCGSVLSNTLCPICSLFHGI